MPKENVDKVLEKDKEKEDELVRDIQALQQSVMNAVSVPANAPTLTKKTPQPAPVPVAVQKP